MTSLFIHRPALLVLLFSSLLFLSPQPSFFLTFTVLPVLVHLSSVLSTYQYLLVTLPTITLASILTSLRTTWSILPSGGQVILLQSLFSSLLSAVIVGIVETPCKSSQRWLPERRRLVSFCIFRFTMVRSMVCMGATFPSRSIWDSFPSAILYIRSTSYLEGNRVAVPPPRPSGLLEEVRKEENL
ncbi:hypothetical protein IAR55_002748 [Kwoniella newhampshirensis]|uniref:Uncharacterized protein n=1 Tax=Kwoniella newhampshirensis TaxID=1651941 RepID=A0AAW0YNW7_9TREE